MKIWFYWVPTDKLKETWDIIINKLALLEQ